MATKPALMNLPIEISDTGFYSRFQQGRHHQCENIGNRADYLGSYFSRKRQQCLKRLKFVSVNQFCQLVYLRHRLLCCGLFVICLGSKLGQALAWQARRHTRIFEFFLVFDDVRRWDWHRDAHLCNRRANLSLW